ncbi:MAG TPA: DNA mismatch repair protein MutS [Candidatus Binatia bacterium]
MTIDPAPQAAPATHDPRREYESRLAERRTRLAAAERRNRALGLARLATFVAGVVLAWLAIDRAALPLAVLLVPIATFAALVLWHVRVRRERERAAGAVRFYERGLARLGDAWPGTGPTSTDYVAEDHPYAADLDVFGHGSLFDLLCDARTRGGERLLAQWLAAPAAPAVVRARQAAVAELRPRLDLREDLAALGGAARSEIEPERLAAWGARPATLTGVAIPVIAALLSLCSIVTLALATRPDASITPFLVAALAQSAFLGAVRGRVAAAQRGLDRAGRELSQLRAILLRLERERFTSPLLAELTARLADDGVPASQTIRGLERRVELADSGRNLLFVPIALLLLWPIQMACAIDRWRARHGARIERWLAAVAEIEALASLAGQAWEHPHDPFPEILEDGAELDAQGLGHPLLPESRCVRNDLRLGPEQRALIVSGSNMSGKSTLLRATGLNVVLALAGAPVRARRFRLTPLAIGASIRVGDSLLDGRSRFQAEVLRLRQITDLAHRSPPLLFLLDEILHGTNSHDRRIGSEAVVRRLLELGAIGLVTTHDLALAEIAGRSTYPIANMHFEDHVEDGTMSFDYRMRPGVVTRSNALALMRAAGLDV